MSLNTILAQYLLAQPPLSAIQYLVPRVLCPSRNSAWMVVIECMSPHYPAGGTDDCRHTNVLAPNLLFCSCLTIPTGIHRQVQVQCKASIPSAVPFEGPQPHGGDLCGGEGCRVCLPLPQPWGRCGATHRVFQVTPHLIAAIS